MKRKTITIDDDLYEALQKIRAAIIASGRDITFTRLVKTVMISGILSAEKLDDEICEELWEFIQGRELDLQLEKLVDEYTRHILKKVEEVTRW